MSKDVITKELQIKYVNKYEMFETFRKNDVKREYLDITRDFINNFIYNLHTTYFGCEFLKTEQDIKNHFNWCLEKTITNFKFINFKFEYKKQVSVLLFEHAKNFIYNNKDYSDDNMFFDIEYFSNLLNYDTQKTVTDITNMFDIYFTLINFIV